MPPIAPFLVHLTSLCRKWTLNLILPNNFLQSETTAFHLWTICDGNNLPKLHRHISIIVSTSKIRYHQPPHLSSLIDHHNICKLWYNRLPNPKFIYPLFCIWIQKVFRCRLLCLFQILRERASYRIKYFQNGV